MGLLCSTEKLPVAVALGTFPQGACARHAHAVRHKRAHNAKREHTEDTHKPRAYITRRRYLPRAKGEGDIKAKPQRHKGVPKLVDKDSAPQYRAIKDAVVQHRDHAALRPTPEIEEAQGCENPKNRQKHMCPEGNTPNCEQEEVPLVH